MQQIPLKQLNWGKLKFPIDKNNPKHEASVYSWHLQFQWFFLELHLEFHVCLCYICVHAVFIAAVFLYIWISMCIWLLVGFCFHVWGWFFVLVSNLCTVFSWAVASSESMKHGWRSIVNEYGPAKAQEAVSWPTKKPGRKSRKLQSCKYQSPRHPFLECGACPPCWGGGVCGQEHSAVTCWDESWLSKASEEMRTPFKCLGQEYPFEDC